LPSAFPLLDINRLQLERNNLVKTGRISFGILSVFLVLLLNLLASSPSLHEKFHADADHAEHQCAVTLFAHGQVDSACVDIPVSAPLNFVTAVAFADLSIFSPAIEHLPAGRAPPVSPCPS
jgi:hypothetical protein